MKKIYIAAPMFSSSELQFNEELANALENIGLSVFLPQRSGYKLVDLMRFMPVAEAVAMIFTRDISEIRNADILIVVLDGRTIDEGACVELGFAYAQGKKCYGLKTGPRTMMNGQINPMISECLIDIYTTIDELLIKITEEN